MMKTIKEIENPPHFQLITGNEQLLELCVRAEKQPVVALDTEFVRVRTLYPKLGLIQLYDGEQLSLIDPQQITDFSPFIALLQNPQITKVLHACSEDLRVFEHYFQTLPRPMMDTQIIAHFVGFPQSTGLSTLLQHYFQLSLDKELSRTDWLARPLSTKQLHYAAADVWYLLPLYQRIMQDLTQTHWLSAAQNECDLLLQKRENDQPCLERAYVHIANAWKLTSQELMCLKLLEKWRQEEAIKRDLALNFVVRAEHLWQIAKHQPKNPSELLNLGVSPFEVRIHGKKMLQLVRQAQKTEPNEYPQPIVRIVDDPRYKKAIKILQQGLKELQPQGLALDLLASRRSVEQLIKWHWLKGQDPHNLPDLLMGWRREFGLKLLAKLQSLD